MNMSDTYRSAFCTESDLRASITSLKDKEVDLFSRVGKKSGVFGVSFLLISECFFLYDIPKELFDSIVFLVATLSTLIAAVTLYFSLNVKSKFSEIEYSLESLEEDLIAESPINNEMYKKLLVKERVLKKQRMLFKDEGESILSNYERFCELIEMIQTETSEINKNSSNPNKSLVGTANAAR